MKVIGITGGIGSGKSEVIQLLKNHWNAYVILADEVGHRLMEKGQKTYEVLVNYYGNNILNKDNTINREVLSKIAFKDEKSVAIINELTHPIIKNEIIKEIQLVKSENKYSFIGLEAAILKEGKLDSLCDEIWYVYAEESVRVSRLMSGRGYSKERCYQIIKRQKNEEYYKSISNWIIDNSKTIEYTKEQLEKKLTSLFLQ